MVLAERLFQADSNAALAILAAYPRDEGADARWRLALFGMNLLLEDAGLDLAGKKLLLSHTASAFRAEFRFRDGAEYQLGTSFRKERRSLEAMLSRQAPEAFNACLGSHLHMMANRLLRNAQRAQEMLIYDFLDRVYGSRLARLR